MKTFNSIYTILLLTGVLAFLFSCEESEDFERYTPERITGEDDVVTYDNVVTYPYIDFIETDTPNVSLTGGFGFVLDSIEAPLESTFQRNKFSIDRSTGVISYENAGELSAGIYSFNVGMTTAYGLVMFKDVVSIEVLDVPANVTIDNPVVEAGALQVGVIATLSYTDTSEGDITSLSYGFVNDVEGFEIDASTGEISKTGSVTEATTVLSIEATTNLGIKIFQNVLTVNVGQAPTLNYHQSDGVTGLAKVTLSPWSPYTTSKPSLNGMESGGGFEITLPAGLSGYAGSFGIDDEGKISIVADADLPEGDHVLGVVATNSGGISASFDNLFTVSVVAVWDEITNDQMNEGNGDGDSPEVVYPGAWQNYNNGPGASFVKKVGVQGFDGIRVFRPDHQSCDVSLTRNVDVTGYKKLQVTFGEFTGQTQGGGNGDFFESYDRIVYFSDNESDIAGGAFDASNWATIMGPDDGWSTETGGSEYVNNIDISSLTGGTLYLHWRIVPDPSSVAIDRNGQWMIDYLSISGAGAYPAIEE